MDAAARQELPPFRKVHFVPARVDVEKRPDGTLILTNPNPLPDPAPNMIEPLRRWAAAEPERTFLARRGADGEWLRCSYAEASASVNAIAQELINAGLGPDAPLMILSGNSIEHALMTYGAILAGAPAAPVSAAYSLMSENFERLRYVFDLIKPKAVFVQDGKQFAKALAALDLTGVEVISVDNPWTEGKWRTYEEILGTEPTADVEKAYDSLTFDTVAKYLFTSGSTGMPKAVINTHRMICTTAMMVKSVTADPEPVPPVLLSWLPWNHSFGANAVLNNMINSGGTMYIDDGRPVPGQFDETLRNLREISPTSYSNVPAAYAMLVPELEKDRELARTFFANLKSVSYGGAAMSQDIYDRFQKVAVETTGERIFFGSGYGATETAPTICNVHWMTERTGLLGLPLPGIELKLAPVGEKLEVRVRGDAVTPGYYKRPDLTAAAFDEEGFYCLGDAAKFVDPEDPSKGLVFDGRVAEDFKLSTGTWVNAGRLRIQVLEAAGGLLQDALIAGLDRKYIGVLGFPNIAACRAEAGDAALGLAEIVNHPAIAARLRAGLQGHNKAHPGSSTAVKRALLMDEPPSHDAGEITDKGYINQRTSLDRRKELVEKLYADPPGNDVILL